MYSYEIYNPKIKEWQTVNLIDPLNIVQEVEGYTPEGEPCYRSVISTSYRNFKILKQEGF